MSNKIISINPSLFSMNSKTRKRKEKTNNNITPIVSPNLIKTKLLKRIKEHKKNEVDIKINSDVKNADNPTPTFTDEFNDSLNYLQLLAKQKKEKELKQKQYEMLQRKTVKNYTPSLHSPYVNIDLPEDLKETFTGDLSGEPIVITKNEDIPYGILKGGTKPTYSQWNKTQKANVSFQTPTSNLSDREKRLQLLRDKIKQKKMQLKSDEFKDSNNIPPIQSPPIQSPPVQTFNISQMPVQNPQSIKESEQTIDNIMLSENLIKKPTTEVNSISSGGGIRKKIIKKTIKKKYTLGKSHIKRQIGVLLKDHATRKNVINAQRDLKGKPIHTVKNYLREHNLIKVGSNAPNDVIRKMYETVMLTGDVNNSNVDTLLHNLKNDTTDK